MAICDLQLGGWSQVTAAESPEAFDFSPKFHHYTPWN